MVNRSDAIKKRFQQVATLKGDAYDLIVHNHSQLATMPDANRLAFRLCASFRHFAYAYLLLSALSGAVASDPTDETLGEFHDWTDATGKFTVKAQFVGVEFDKANATNLVILKQSDGKISKVPIDKLDRNSQSLARRLASQQSDERGRRSPTEDAVVARLRQLGAVVEKLSYASAGGPWRLDLSGVQVTDELLDDLQRLGVVYELRLENTRVSDEQIQFLGSGPFVKRRDGSTVHVSIY